ncbi:hypothetical protein DAI22_09g053500 [Oryza sativa Japonica Group]|nr:hypothetical protein DAI22_09g053500 [Oryza sativa Japonica Group]
MQRWFQAFSFRQASVMNFKSYISKKTKRQMMPIIDLACFKFKASKKLVRLACFPYHFFR